MDTSIGPNDPYGGTTSSLYETSQFEESTSQYEGTSQYEESTSQFDDMRGGGAGGGEDSLAQDLDMSPDEEENSENDLPKTPGMCMIFI